MSATKKGRLDPAGFTIDDSYVVSLSDEGVMGYVHYEVMDAHGNRIAAGGISRLNYGSDRAHRAEIRKVARAAIAKHEGRS